MSRITKELAEQVAFKMTVEKKKEVEFLRKELQDYIRNYAISLLPKEVLKMFKSHPEYFSKQSNIQFVGNGFHYDSFYFGDSLPIKDARTLPDNTTAKAVLSIKNKLDIKEKEVRCLNSEIANALYNLRTYSNVEKNFNEAFAFLPKVKNESLIVNVDSIRKKLNG